MNKFTFRGFIAPVFTPFKDDENRSLNLDVIPDYAYYLLDLGISGILVNGTTGEGPSLSLEERKEITSTWVQICAKTKQHLMIQVGGAPLPDVLELARHAEANHVEALLCLPDLYFKPNSCEELANYLQLVSNAAPNTPLLYYHIPMFTNVNLHMGEFLREAAHKIKTFIGIKFTSNNLDEGTAALRAQDRKYLVCLGADTIMAGAFVMGFDSVIATTLNFVPNISVKISSSIKSGNIIAAQESQQQLNDIITTVTKHGSWVSTMKTAMNAVSPINVGPIRSPLVALTSSQSKEMVEKLKELKLK